MRRLLERALLGDPWPWHAVLAAAGLIYAGFAAVDAQWAFTAAGAAAAVYFGRHALRGFRHRHDEPDGRHRPDRAP